MLYSRKCSCGKHFQTRIEKRCFCSQKCFRNWLKENKENDDKRTEEEVLKQDFNLFVDKKGKIRGGKCFNVGHTINDNREPWNKDKKNLQVAWNKGLVMKNYYDDEQYKKFLKGCIRGGVATCLSVASKKQRTKIELLLEEIVKCLGFRYFVQYPLLGITVADIYLPDNHVAIYADGDYWHNYPHGTKKDKEVNRDLENAHIKVLRFWEKDFKENQELIKQKIREIQRL